MSEAIQAKRRCDRLKDWLAIALLAEGLITILGRSDHISWIFPSMVSRTFCRTIRSRALAMLFGSTFRPPIQRSYLPSHSP